MNIGQSDICGQRGDGGNVDWHDLIQFVRIGDVDARLIGDDGVVDGDVNPRGIESDDHRICGVRCDGKVCVLLKAIGAIGNIKYKLIGIVVNPECWESVIFIALMVR